MIRPLSPQDASAIHGLNLQLGYEVDIDFIKSQAEILEGKPGHRVFIYAKNNEVLGYIHASYMARLTSEPFWEIVALVVDEKTRKSGIGRQLVEHLIRILGSGAKLRVRCNRKRQGAHAFYERLGFVLNKEQKVFKHSNNQTS